MIKRLKIYCAFESMKLTDMMIWFIELSVKQKLPYIVLLVYRNLQNEPYDQCNHKKITYERENNKFFAKQTRQTHNVFG